MLGIRSMLRPLSCLSIIITVVLVSPAQISYAAPMSKEQQQLFEKAIFYTNAAVDCVAFGGTSNSISFIGNDNKSTAFNYFIRAGLTPAQSAGIVGNLMQESGVNPRSHENGGGPGRGIAQWLVSDRWQQYLNWDGRKGRDQYDLLAQLDFMWHELNTSNKGSLDAVRATSTARDAAIQFELLYERSADFMKADGTPGTKGMENRLKFAASFGTDTGSTTVSSWGNGYMNSAATTSGYASASTGGWSTTATTTNTTSTPSSTTTSATSAVSGCTGSVVATDFASNMTIYKQTDKPWASDPYGTSTVAEEGCGPTAMATIITALTGQSVTPRETAAYGMAHGTAAPPPGGGSYRNIPAVLAPNWGLSTEKIDADVAAINQALAKGRLVMMSGMGPLPFSNNGHFIVIRAVTAEGKWRIANSMYQETNSIEYDPAYILDTVVGSDRTDSIYGVYKAVSA